ncbi:MAG: WalW protein [Sphingomonas sp. 28-66-16]|nr:MAG: WalW protein [Sphingomonas sp. 28-66-16]
MPDSASPVAHRHGYVVPPPSPDALIDWPADFGTRFVVMVDTEEEFDWNAPLARTGHATATIAALPEAQAWFAARAVPLTYLIDYPVVSDARAVAVLAELVGTGMAAVGAQLHPWVNPPHDEALTPVNSFVGNLPPALEAAKLDALTAAIADAFGAPPAVYRAGRYGIGPATLALLAARGYRLDSSMRARYDYAGEGGPDFRAIGNAAFRAGPDGALIALPLTTVFTGRLRAGGRTLYRWSGRIPRGRGVLARAGLLSRVALTPEEMPIADALEAVRVALGEGLRVLNFSFHSPSLVPGHTPYVRDARDLAAFYRWWDQVLALLAARGARAIASDALIAAARLAARPCLP